MEASGASLRLHSRQASSAPLWQVSPVWAFLHMYGRALLLTVKQALLAFRDQSSWKQLMRTGMNKDFSWNASAKEYLRVYERVRQGRGGSAVQVPRGEAIDLQPIGR